MTGAPRTRLALLGCGLIGLEHMRAWQAVAAAAPGTFEIVAVCDADPGLAQRAADHVTSWQDRHPLVFTDAEALIGSAALDGLDICLPVHLHEQAACTALAQGVHVLVEKPLAQTIPAARRMVETARAAGLVLSLAENHRRSPSIRTAHWLIQKQRALGEPQIFHAQRSRYRAPLPQQWHWRADRRLSGGGWAIDNGAHLLDVMRYLFGPVESVTALAKRMVDQPLDGGSVNVDQREDLLAGLLNFTNGMTGIFSSTSGLPGNEYFHFSIQGTAGALVCDGGQLFHAPLPEARIRDQRGNTRQLDEYTADFLQSLSGKESDRLFPHGLRQDFPIECAEFLRAIRQGGSVEIDGLSAMETLATSLAFYESAVIRETVQVADVMAGRVHAYQASIAAPDGPLQHDFREQVTRWP
ncbi:hypothetical protein BJF79_09620 [Actinomadura sp. CNU-125]|uniref:Gfo/Idh/MocA family protein n=1 Tax=Actinomadura sp. CNU-125 TaxID=1904961 RepID=UPI0009645D3F|nr:Gfo/Idh/MocA family oxidoreductase [Actinomadura sp. CNU-125]OLT30494.1 hypothetical protein BJF79_09620 [Actinomadura sp. CNU-125]